jgi:hypothetical protein
MTVLSPSTPTLRAQDSLRLVYNGTYAKTVAIDDSTKPGGVRIGLETVEGPLPFGRFSWDGEDYLGGLEAGQAKLVPFDLVRVFFGDPRSVNGVQGRTEDKNGVGDIAPRENEIRRLCVLYGIYDVNADLLAQAVPDVTITTGDDIEVICPATDPDGKHSYGFEASSAEVHDVATQLSKMREQIKMLETQAAAEAKRPAKNDGADVTVDGPPAKR